MDTSSTSSLPVRPSEASKDSKQPPNPVSSNEDPSGPAAPNSVPTLPESAQPTISKAKAKKDAKKESKKESVITDQKHAPSKSSTSKSATQHPPKPITIEPESMFKVGSLSNVYKKKPVGAGGIE